MRAPCWVSIWASTLAEITSLSTSTPSQSKMSRSAMGTGGVCPLHRLRRLRSSASQGRSRSTDVGSCPAKRRSGTAEGGGGGEYAQSAHHHRIPRGPRTLPALSRPADEAFQRRLRAVGPQRAERGREGLG